MNRIRQTISVALVFAVLGLGLTATQAQTPRTYRVNDRQVDNLLRRIETDADRFRSSFSMALDRSRHNGTSTEDQLNGYVQNFETATDQLRSRFNSRNAAAADVENVLRQAAFLNDFMMSNRLDAAASNDWTTLRADLDALARAYNVTWDWSRQSGATYGAPGYGNAGAAQTGAAYRISDRQLDAIIRRVENGADRFRANLGTALNRSTYNGTRAEDNINQFVRDFETATDQLRSRFDGRTSVAGDVENVLRQATYIDDFMTRQTLSVRAENDWTTLKGDLNQLASAYSVAWNWDVRSLPGYGTDTTAGGGVFGQNERRGGGGVRAANRLTGTFRLDTTQSDNATNAAETAVRSLPVGDRSRVREQLMRRLDAPEMLAIERNGNSVTIASSRAPQTTFVANAAEAREQLPNGSYSRVASTIVGDRLVVRSSGNRETDFTVTFDPIEGGRRLRVTREIWNERLGVNPIVVRNVYERTSDVAEWNVYNGSTAGYGQTGSTGVNSSAGGDFAVADGQVLTARLESDLTTRTVQTGDRFTLTVTSPAQFQGAVIEGHVASSSRSGRVTGRSDIALNFDSIRLNGRTYQFAGFIETVRGMNGETVQVDNEGTVRDDSSRGTQTAQRAAIGTAVGAIIGAIAGGGKGAAIGAAIGAGAGAGSIYVQGREDLELMRGSELTIRASAPNR
ncbi:MAG TPA: YMGG-like glycine zipper-containing protein [Pyrinomonadaceae bacterium]